MTQKASEKIVRKIKEQADIFAKTAEKKFHVTLDYSEEALALVDDLITLFFKIHRDHFIKATVFIGSYVGETIIRNMGGAWMKDLSIARVGDLKGSAHPMTRARKRLANGTDDSIVHYYKNLKLSNCKDSTFAKDAKKLDDYGDVLLADGWDMVLLARMLNSEEPRYVREEAAELLGRLAKENIGDSLVKAVKNPDTVYYAAIALQGRPIKVAYPYLIESLKKDIPADIKQQILLAIGKMEVPEAVDEIINFLDDEDEIIGHFAAIALGKLGGDEVVDKLLAVMAGLRPGKRCHAITALELLSDERAVPALIEALFSTEEEIREAAARALQYIPDERALKPLQYCLKDPSSRIRVYAAYAIANIGGTEAVECINKLLTDEVQNVRLHATNLVNWLKNGGKPVAKVI